MTRKQFTLYMENKPGALATVTRKLAKENVNIDGISAYSSADIGLVQVVVSNATRTRRILAAARIAFTVQDVLLIPLKNEVGALAGICGKLSRAGVNINYVYATGCDCRGDCFCDVIISAPDLKKVAKVLEA